MVKGVLKAPVPESQNVKMNWTFKKNWSAAGAYCSLNKEKGFNCLECFREKYGNEQWFRYAMNVTECFIGCVDAVTSELSGQQARLEEACRMGCRVFFVPQKLTCLRTLILNSAKRYSCVGRT